MYMGLYHPYMIPSQYISTWRVGTETQKCTFLTNRTFNKGWKVRHRTSSVYSLSWSSLEVWTMHSYCFLQLLSPKYTPLCPALKSVNFQHSTVLMKQNAFTINESQWITFALCFNKLPWDHLFQRGWRTVSGFLPWKWNRRQTDDISH